MKVYDLLNAGPRHRFTVRGKDGRPFLVSNCVQAIAADILREQLIEADTRYRAEKPSDTIRVVMQTHDEIVCVIPKVLADTKVWNEEKGKFEITQKGKFRDYVFKIMRKPVDYLPGLPLDAEVGTDLRYGMAK